MFTIKPVSDLRDYNKVLKDVAVGEPVFLTKNGQGRYAIIDLGEYEKTHAIAQLDEALAAGERSVRREGWRSLASVKHGRERVRG